MIFKQKKTIPSIAVENAKDLLKDGMTHYIGGIPVWLKEYDAIADWLTDNKGKGLLAVGKKGRGKTVVCMDVIPDILESKGFPCLRLSSYAMSRNVDAIFKARVLMIDDIGTEDVASFYGERHDLFKEIVDHAEREAVLLIVTTNLTLDDLNQRYGERVVDRLKGIVLPVVFSQGESLRGVKLEMPSYAYGVRFDTLEEADKFAAEQERIRDGIENGSITLFDEKARDAFEVMEALAESNGTAFKYGTVPND